MKKLSLLALCVIFSMLFFVSCGSDGDEDTVDTGTTSDTDKTDSDADTTDTTDPTNPTNPTEPTDDPTEPTDNPTEPTDDPTEPTDNPTEPTDDPTNPTNPTEPTDDPTDNPTEPTDQTDPTNPGEGGDNLNTGDTSGNQAQSGKPGAACSDDDDCKGNFGSGDSEQIPVCLTSNDIAFPSPSGYCSYFCDITDSGACDSAGELCYLYSNFNGVCLHKCTKPSDCRVGYRCSNTIHACLPDCANSECKTGVCDPTDKVCLKEKEN